MTYWQILEIEQTSDKREIKRAYAKRLKSTRPDQDPEGFKELRAAYESALSMTGYLEYQESDLETVSGDDLSGVRLSSNDLEYSQAQGDDTSIDHKVVASPEDSYVMEASADQSQQDGEPEIENHFGFDQAAVYDHQALYALELEQLALAKKLFSDPDWKRDEQEWESVMYSPLMDDLYVKQGFTVSIFNLAIKAIRRERLKNRPRLKPLLEVVNELENVFNWKFQTELLDTYVDHSDLELFDEYFNPEYRTSFTSKHFCDKQHIGKMSRVVGGERSSAFFIDLFVFGGACIVWNMYVDYQFAFGSTFRQNGTLWFFLWFFCYFTVMEASPFQGSLGRIITHQKVVTKTGRRLNILHSLWRSIAFWTYIVTIKVSVWFGFLIKDGRTVNDVISGTQVINK